jgi:hypothetical protein
MPRISTAGANSRAVRKALATFGTGPAARLLEITFPSFRAYASRHGYELVVGDGESYGRPASWGKIPFLQRLLISHEFVLWIDADALILDHSLDIETVIPKDAFQAFVVTPFHPGNGAAPCAGVWALRAGERAQQFLTKLWEQHDLIQHAWWDQAALQRLTGWTTSGPLFKKERESEWDEGTFWLDEEWDMLIGQPIEFAPGRIRHYAGKPYDRRLFEMRTDLAHGPRRWLGMLTRRWPNFWHIHDFLHYRLGLVRSMIVRPSRP